MEKYVPFFQGEKRSITERLAEYFEKHGLDSKIHYDEEREAYILSVPADRENEAKKRYQDFYFNERERVEREEKNQDFLSNYDESKMLSEGSFEDTYSNMTQDISLDDISNSYSYSSDFDTSSDYDEDPAYAVTTETDANDEGDQEDSTDETEDEAEEDEKTLVKRLISGSGNYVFKSEKYKDYTGTLYTFLILGIAGLIFVILNITNVLNVLNGLFPNLIMGALFIFFIFEAISTGRKAQKLKAEIEEENQLTEKINEWLRNNVTEEFLASISSDQVSEELDYIKKTETIRNMLISEFGEQNPDYLDRLIDEYYSKTFDSSDDYSEV